jgi:hypothetical protein
MAISEGMGRKIKLSKEIYGREESTCYSFYLKKVIRRTTWR